MSDRPPVLHRAWLPPINQHETDTRAALLDRPPATTMGDVAGLIAGPTFRFITRRCAAIRAAWCAYRSSVK